MTDLTPGCIVRYFGKHGMIAGEYIRTMKNGKIVIRVPELGNREVRLTPEQVHSTKERT